MSRLRELFNDFWFIKDRLRLSILALVFFNGLYLRLLLFWYSWLACRTGLVTSLILGEKTFRRDLSKIFCMFF